MKISVIIPVHNGLKYIRDCLQSIKIQDMDLEVVIIDDKSTDGLEENLPLILTEIELDNVLYIKNDEKLGPAETRNKGISQSSGDYIAFLDADDWWEPNKLKEQIELIQKDNVKLVYTGRRNIYEDGTEKNVPCLEYVDYEIMLKNNQITCSSVLIDAELARKYPMERSDLCEDYYTWLKIIKDCHQAAGINKPLVNYRVHKGSISSNKMKHARKRYEVYKLLGVKPIKRIYCSLYYMVAGVFKYYIGKQGNEK